MPPVITSPCFTGPTPSGVPVMMRSPGRSSIEREAMAMMSRTGQISLAMSEILLHLAVHRKPDAAPISGWPTSSTRRSGAIGAEKSKPLPQSHGRPCSRA